MDTITHTSNRLGEIRDRLDAATPGEWTAAIVDSPRASVTTGIYSHAFPTGTPASVVLPSYPIQPGSPRLSRADAELIANATADLAWLLAEVTRLTEAVAEATATAPTCESCGNEQERLALDTFGRYLPDPNGIWLCEWCDTVCMTCADLTGTCAC